MSCGRRSLRSVHSMLQNVGSGGADAPVAKENQFLAAQFLQVSNWRHGIGRLQASFKSNGTPWHAVKRGLTPFLIRLIYETCIREGHEVFLETLGPPSEKTTS